MAITVIRHGITLDELDAWGSVADLGSEILEGEVKAFGKMTAGAPTDPVSAAYFGTTAGKFRMTYPFSEQATVVSGEVRLTDESTGQSTLYKAGDSWFVSKGTPVLWEVADGGFVEGGISFVTEGSGVRQGGRPGAARARGCWRAMTTNAQDWSGVGKF